MQIRFVSKLAIGLTAFSLVACNSSSAPTPGGQICNEGHDPFSDSHIPAGRKPIPAKPKDNEAMPPDNRMLPGTYTYGNGDIIYKEKGKQEPLKIHFRDYATNGESQRQSIFCTENGGLGMQMPKAEVNMVTDMIVCSDFRQIVRSRKFVVSVTDGRITFDKPEKIGGAAWCADSAEKVYEKDRAYFVKDNDQWFEARSERNLGSGDITTSVSMTYKPFAKDASTKVIEAPECSQCVPVEKPTDTGKKNPTPIANKNQDRK